MPYTELSDLHNESAVRDHGGVVLLSLFQVPKGFRFYSIRNTEDDTSQVTNTVNI